MSEPPWPGSWLGRPWVARAVAWTRAWANRGVGILGILGKAGAQCRMMRGLAHTFASSCQLVVDAKRLFLRSIHSRDKAAAKNAQDLSLTKS